MDMLLCAVVEKNNTFEQKAWDLPFPPISYGGGNGL